jgi:6-phosphofructokinase 1
MLASRMGYKAVELLRDDSSSRAVGIRGTEIVHYDLEDALKMTREYDSGINDLAEILSI